MHTRTLGLILFVILAAAALWALGLFGGGSDATPLAAAAPNAAPVPVQAEPAAAAVPLATSELPTRIAIEPGAGPGAVGPALVGTVLDDAGAVIAGAVVACTPAGFSGDFSNLDPSDLDMDFDQTAMLARVRAQQEQRVEVATDAEGRFRLVAKGKSRSVDVRVKARSHVALEQQAQRPTDVDIDLGALSLKRGAVVSGRVVDRQGQPASGARVAQRTRAEAMVLGSGDFEFPGTDTVEALRDGDLGVTDADGRFELAYVEPGELSLRARHPDHPTARLDGLSVAAGKSLTDVTIVVETGAEIRGRITGVPAGTKGLRVQAASRQPEGAQQQPGIMSFLGGDAGEMFADAGMPFGEKAVDADAEQGFVLRGLHLGRNYRVWAAQSGRGFAGNAVCSQRIEVASGIAGLELRYDAGITVTCRIVDARSSEPLERLWVRDQLEGGGGIDEMMTVYMPRKNGSKEYPDGQVTITNLRPKKKQTLSLVVEALGHARFERVGIVLPTAGNLDLGTLRLDARPVVHVTVTAKDGGKPVAGANVLVREQGGQQDGDPYQGIPGMPNHAGAHAARSDADGRCDLNAFPGASVVIAVTTRDHAPYASEPLTLPEHDDCQHSAQLLRGGAVEVTVAEPDGTPVGDLRVEHVAENGHRDDRKTDATGRVTFDRLVPGAHRFRLGPRSNGPFDMPMAVAQRAAGGRAPAEAGWETSDVADGSKATLRLLRTPTASLRGIVRENGAPLAGARIAFVEGTGNGGDDADNGPQGEMFAALAEMGGRGGNSRSTKSGDDGSYQLKDLAAGEHRLRITHRERSMPAVVAVVLRTGENTFAVELDTTLLRGTVRDPHGDPVAGATITVHQAKSADAGGSADVGEIMGAVMPGMNLGGNRATVKTGADGSYELRGVQAGIRLQVRATAKGFAAAAAAPVEVARGGSRDTVDLQLAAAGRIRVTATDAGPFTAAHATFAEADPDKHVAPAFVILRNGSGTLDGLRPGRWKVEIGGASGTQGEPQFVEVTAGETANASF